MKERIKKLRKHLDLTQREFGERIGIKGTSIANYELGRNEPIDAVISLICREFNVNEAWLRSGTGEMFIEMDKELQLMEWAGRVLGSESQDFKKKFIKMLMSLSENEWEWLEQKAKELAGHDEEGQ